MSGFTARRLTFGIALTTPLPAAVPQDRLSPPTSWSRVGSINDRNDGIVGRVWITLNVTFPKFRSLSNAVTAAKHGLPFHKHVPGKSEFGPNCSSPLPEAPVLLSDVRATPLCGWN